MKDSQGKLIRTICGTEISQTYYENQLLCANMNLDLVKADTTAMRTALQQFTSELYDQLLPGVFFVEGIKKFGYCNVLSNYEAWNSTLYRWEEFPCWSSNYAFCQFKIRNLCLLLLCGIRFEIYLSKFS